MFRRSFWAFLALAAVTLGVGIPAVAHISAGRYKRLTNAVDADSNGVYWDKTNSRMVTSSGDTVYEAPLHIASQAQGDILIRGASTWERLGSSRGDMLIRGASNWGVTSAKTLGAQLVGDGTDVVVGKAATLRSVDEYRKNRMSINFLKQPQVPIFKKLTMAIVTAAAEEDFFWIGPHYFEISQPTANIELAATGLTPGAGGWLLPGDNAAADYIEITRGIVAGSAQSFTTGTDAFYSRAVFLITTRANHTHLYTGFRPLGAYADTKTNADHLAAYSGAGDDKFAIGISTNAGVLTRHVTKAGADTATNATHAAIANATAVALEITCTAALSCTYKIGHDDATGHTAYADLEVDRLAAIADLTADASWTASTVTTAITVVPYIAYGMAGGTAISDTRLMSWEVSYTE